MHLPDLLERTDANERYVDYCLWEYPPFRPHAGKFRSVNLMLSTLEHTGLLEPGVKLIQALREGVGVDLTVVGVKYKDGVIGWELYFYDYKRRQRKLSMGRAIQALWPIAECTVVPNESLHYFMFSLDVDAALLEGRRTLDQIHMYIGNPGSSVSSGICYSLTPGETRLENFYFFFDAKKELDEIRAKIICSAHVDLVQMSLDEVLWPELLDTRVIVVANKQGADGIYFSGINVDQLILFLKRMSYPAPLVAFIVNNRASLDHMQYDVGFDYRLVDGKLHILKSGYYAVF